MCVKILSFSDLVFGFDYVLRRRVLKEPSFFYGSETWVVLRRPNCGNGDLVGFLQSNRNWVLSGFGYKCDEKWGIMQLLCTLR